MKRTLIGLVCLALGGCLQRPTPVIAKLPPISCPVPQEIRQSCPRPQIPKGSLTPAAVENFSLAQEAALTVCDSRRARAVTVTGLCEQAANRRK